MKIFIVNLRVRIQIVSFGSNSSKHVLGNRGLLFKNYVSVEFSVTDNW